MQYKYRTDIVIAAVDQLLEAIYVPESASYSLQAVIYDKWYGWYDAMVAVAVKPSYVLLDEEEFQDLHPYLLKEV